MDILGAIGGQIYALLVDFGDVLRAWDELTPLGLLHLKHDLVRDHDMMPRGSHCMAYGSLDLLVRA